MPEIFKGLKDFHAPAAGSAVTIGVFDGVHIGHAKLIKRAVARARALKAKSVVLTFDPHPLKVLNPKSVGALSLISLAHRLRLIGALGVDSIVVIKFTKAFAGMSAEDFLKDIIAGKLNARELVISDNFYFGKGARGGKGLLNKAARGYGFRVDRVRGVKVAKRTVSSSVIRRLILRGRLAKASHLLGRHVSILGTVVGGSRLARRLGYPTANINPHHEIVPPKGVYAVRVAVGSKLFDGILNIGTRPTFYGPRDMEPTIEAHIFGFRGRIYGKDIEVFFIKRLRDERIFKSPESLIARIRIDERTARRELRRQKCFTKTQRYANMMQTKG